MRGIRVEVATWDRTVGGVFRWGETILSATRRVQVLCFDCPPLRPIPYGRTAKAVLFLPCSCQAPPLQYVRDSKTMLNRTYWKPLTHVLAHPNEHLAPADTLCELHADRNQRTGVPSVLRRPVPV